MTDPRGYTHENYPAADGEYHALPDEAGDGWEFLLGLDVIVVGDEFWATGRGCWVQILEPNTLGLPAAYLIGSMETRVRRLTK